MKYTFSDLVFEPYSAWPNTEEAIVKLKNGYTVKILRGEGAAHTYGAPYEVSMTPISSAIMEEPIGYLSDKQVIQLIHEIQNLPKLTNV